MLETSRETDGRRNETGVREGKRVDRNTTWKSLEKYSI